MKELGVGEGLNELELGVRLRYEFRREFASTSGSRGRASSGKPTISRGPKETMFRKLTFVVGVGFWF